MYQMFALYFILSCINFMGLIWGKCKSVLMGKEEIQLHFYFEFIWEKVRTIGGRMVQQMIHNKEVVCKIEGLGNENG